LPRRIIIIFGGNEWALVGTGQPHLLFFDPQEKRVLLVSCAQASTRRRGVLPSVPWGEL